MRPKKKWGQNFLRNRGAVEKIVAAIDPQPDEVVLEIGPGEGVLTEKLVELPNRVIADRNCRRAVFMLQKEVADRIVAKPATEAYGFLTLYVQAFASAKIVMTLEPRSFYPPPKVRSAVVVLDPRDPGLVSPREEVLDLVSASFRMRRKKLVNNLIGWRGLTRVGVLEAMEGAGVDVDARAETLTLAEFDRLSRLAAMATQ